MQALSQPGHPLNSRWRQILWLLVVLGLVVPWFFNLRYFLWEGGLAQLHRYLLVATVNTVSTAITLDVYLAAACFSVWVWRERRVPRPGLYVALCFLVGLSFAFPLYLLRRRQTA